MQGLKAVENLSEASDVGTPTISFFGADRIKLKKKEEKSVDASAKVGELVTQNPGVSGPTLLNLLKSNGLKVVDATAKLPSTPPEKAIETNSASASPGVMLPFQKKESSSFAIKNNCKFLEKGSADNGIGPLKFKVVLIEEGLGNFGDAFYYTREAIRSAAAGVFEGKKAYANHPRRSEEMDIPERDVKDILGWFEDVRVEEAADQSTMLVGNLTMMPERSFDWARCLVIAAIEYNKKFPDKEFVGLSINANGDADEMGIDELLMSVSIPESAKPKLLEAKNKGITTVKRVHEITSAVSCDLVTEAGARGRVLNLIEQEKEMARKKKEAIKVEEKAVEVVEAKPVDAEKKEEPKQEEPAPKEEPKEEPKKEGEEPKQQNEQTPHSDEDEDKKIIQQMIIDYLGDFADDYAEGMAKEALGNAKEMGYEGEEAAKCAGYSVKMAYHAHNKSQKPQDQEKKPEMESKEGEVSEAEVVESQKESETKEAPVQEASSTEAKEMDVKESKEYMELHAEATKLRETVKSFELNEFLDKTLRESGRPMSVTKSFREFLGTPKNESEITDKWTGWVKAYDLGSEADGLGGFTLAEKAEIGTKPKLDFSDCKND